MTVVKPENRGVLLCSGQRTRSTDVEQGYLLAHLSDPHLTSLRHIQARVLFNKRVLGYLSWRMRRRHEYKRDVLSVLVRDLNARIPDHVVITGDLTHLGLPSEFQEVRQWLARTRIRHHR